MKLNTIFFVLASVLLLTACNTFSSKNNQANPLLGKWKIDSLYTSDTSSDNMAVMLLAMAIKDTGKIVLDFQKDSVFTIQDNYITEESPYKFNKHQQTLLITDSSHRKYDYTEINDSMISLADKDSTILFLKRHREW
jgi:hypothetical protein